MKSRSGLAQPHLCSAPFLAKQNLFFALKNLRPSVPLGIQRARGIFSRSSSVGASRRAIHGLVLSFAPARGVADSPLWYVTKLDPHGSVLLALYVCVVFFFFDGAMGMWFWLLSRSKVFRALARIHGPSWC